MIVCNTIQYAGLSDQEQAWAIRVGRDAACLYRSISVREESTACSKAEKLINCECPAQALRLAADTFNQNVGDARCHAELILSQSLCGVQQSIQLQLVS